MDKLAGFGDIWSEFAKGAIKRVRPMAWKLMVPSSEPTRPVGFRQGSTFGKVSSVRSLQNQPALSHSVTGDKYEVSIRVAHTRISATTTERFVMNRVKSAASDVRY